MALASVDRRLMASCECKAGHKWTTRAESLTAGRWCRRCFYNSKLLGLDYCLKLAKSRGGQCLSTTYSGSHDKILWQCAKSHQWRAVLGNVNRGRWCPHCFGFGKTIEDMQALASARNGKCVSKAYRGVFHKLRWRCAKGHVWNTTPQSIRQGHWCRVCSDTARVTHSIDEMHALASSKGGECLSSRYVDSKHPLDWRCSQGHTWVARPEDILHGRWCPECSVGKSERLCRAYLERFFGERFPISRPNWLRNARGNQMELDGYCAALGIAFEYHGRQHFEHHAFYHTRRSSLRQRITDDDLKAKLCRQHGVKLLVIPYTVDESTLLDHVRKQCDRLGIKYRSPSKKFKIDLERASSPRWLEEMQRRARVHGGRCLSTHYLSAQDKLRWACKRGHEWEATPNHIKNGTWCPQCSHRVKRTISDMIAFAKTKGGQCLSTLYRFTDKLRWQCHAGHQWRALWSNVRRGTWCPDCWKTQRQATLSLRNTSPLAAY